MILAALFAVGVQLKVRSAAVNDSDQRLLQQTLEQEAQPGDVVLLQPWWTERERLFVPDTIPVVGYLGDEADPFVPYSRIWVLAQPHQPRTDDAAFEAAFAPKRERVGASRRFGNLELTLYRNLRHRPALYSAVDRFASARVYLEQPGGAQIPCPFDGRAHRCPGNVYVAPEWHEILYQPRRCLWMKPPGGPTKLVMEMADLPPVQQLSLQAGLTWDRGFFHSPSLTPVHVEVDDLAAGAKQVDLTLPPGREGLQQAQSERAPSGPIKLSVQSDNNDVRDVCVELYGYGDTR